MAEQQGKPKKRQRRHRYVVSFRQQAKLTLPFFAAALALGILNSLAHMVMVNYGELWKLEAYEATDLLLLVDLLFLLLAAAVVAVTGLAVSNRVCGPARVIEKAAQRLAAGDFEREVHVRRDDYLVDLAAAVESLRVSMINDRKRLADLDACLREEDLTGAREIVAQLSRQPVAETADQPAQVG